VKNYVGMPSLYGRMTGQPPESHQIFNSVDQREENLSLQWAEKRDACLKSGRWEIMSAGKFLLVQKPQRTHQSCAWLSNKNTHKMTSPLPDMEGVLRRPAEHKYRTALDLKAPMKIRIVPEHVPRAVTTPDGNMSYNKGIATRRLFTKH
jgi:hypothetical protein